MVDVAQSVRALDCGSRCRGFESHLPPQTIAKRVPYIGHAFFYFTTLLTLNNLNYEALHPQKTAQHRANANGRESVL